MAARLAQRFGRNLRRARLDAGLTQNELALLIEVHRVNVGELERGLRLPRLDTILKVSAGAQISPCMLLSGLRWRPGRYVEGGFFIENLRNHGRRK